MEIYSKVCIRLYNSKLREIMKKVELVGVAWSRYSIISVAASLGVLAKVAATEMK